MRSVIAKALMFGAVVALPSSQSVEDHRQLVGSAVTARATCKNIQPHAPAANTTRANAVKQAYVDVWNQYYQYAYPSDELRNGNPPFGSNSSAWKLTVVDGIDTAIIMGLTDIVNIQLNTISKIDFHVTPEIVSTFDATIRWIGGLLSAYDLIKSGLVPFASQYDTNLVNALLKQATLLADLISPRFNTSTGLPRFGVNFTTGQAVDGGFLTPPDTINTAIAGTNILEYHRLSDLTGNSTYRSQADKAESYILKPNPPRQYPNIVGGNLRISTGEFLDNSGGWGSGIDSFYEYLIKSVIYDPSQSLASTYTNFWTTAVESTMKYLLIHPSANKFPGLAYITDLDNSGNPSYSQSDYTCFAGGNFLLGGAYLGRQDFIQLGLTITDSCRKQYNDTVSGLNPINIAWYGPNGNASDSQYNGNSATARMARSQYNQYGYFITNPLNTQLPEPIESIFYASRITGDTKWSDAQWKIFQAFQKNGHQDNQVAGPWANVSQPLGGGFDGGLFGFPVASYYFAETLKYFYLTFSDPTLVSLNDFQFNTEGHPLRVQRGTCTTPGS